MVAVARLVGLEPTAYGLEVRCSIQLSYRRLGDGRISQIAQEIGDVHRKGKLHPDPIGDAITGKYSMKVDEP